MGITSFCIINCGLDVIFSCRVDLDTNKQKLYNTLVKQDGCLVRADVTLNYRNTRSALVKKSPFSPILPHSPKIKSSSQNRDRPALPQTVSFHSLSPSSDKLWAKKLAAGRNEVTLHTLCVRHAHNAPLFSPTNSQCAAVLTISSPYQQQRIDPSQ